MPLLLVLVKREKLRRVPRRLCLGTSVAVSDGQRFVFGYRGDLTWDVHREEIHIGTIFLEDWTHYSYILPGNGSITGLETFTDWRATLRALAAA